MVESHSVRASATAKVLSALAKRLVRKRRETSN